MPALIETPQPLRPTGPLRVAMFWTPLALVARQLWTSPRLRSLDAVRQALLGSWLAFSTLWATAYFTASWQLRPLPTDLEIEELGGRRFRRPSDGNVMEYWLAGDLCGKTAVVFCHRMDGKVGAQYGRSKVEAVLKDKGAFLVSPSVPSLGGSPPYDTSSARQWLSQWADDMMFLLRELGVEGVYVVGLSWGAQLCLNLAMACQQQGVLRGVAQIGGNYWDTKKIQYPFGSEIPAWSTIFAKPIVIKPMAYLMIRPFISKMGDVGMMPAHEQESLRQYYGEDLASFGAGMVRSMSFFLHQFWQVGLLANGSRDADEYVQLSQFDSSIPLHVCLGSGDRMADTQQPPFLDQVKHAQLRKFQGSHAGFPLDEIILDLMSSESS